jgi:hypothetical protein
MDSDGTYQFCQYRVRSEFRETYDTTRKIEIRSYAPIYVDNERGENSVDEDGKDDGCEGRSIDGHPPTFSRTSMNRTLPESQNKRPSTQFVRPDCKMTFTGTYRLSFFLELFAKG